MCEHCAKKGTNCMYLYRCIKSWYKGLKKPGHGIASWIGGIRTECLVHKALHWHWVEEEECTCKLLGVLWQGL